MHLWIKLVIGYCIVAAMLWCPISVLLRHWLRSSGWPIPGADPNVAELMVPLSLALAGLAAIVWPLFLPVYAVHALHARARRRQIDSLERAIRLPHR